MSIATRLALVLAISSVSLSTLPLASALAADCSQAQTQTEMNICAGEAYAEADAELNAVYSEARDRMKETDALLGTEQAGAAKALLEAQRAWIRFRDAACEAEGFQYRGGSIEPMIVSLCLERLTRQRTSDLRILLAEN